MADALEALFARAKDRGKQRAKATDAAVARWEWASGRLAGRSPAPFADHLEPARGRLHRKEPATKKHGTTVYGFDERGRVLVVRNHFSATAYTEVQYAYHRDRYEWVAYRHDGALMGVGIARLDATGLPTEIRSRGWDGSGSVERVTSEQGRIVRVEVESRMASGTTSGWVLEASWDEAGLVRLTRRHRGPLATPEVVFAR